LNKIVGSGYLFLPYQTWVTLATALSYCIWRDNGDKPEVENKELKTE
jgi:tryptophan-rich sensory protein